MEYTVAYTPEQNGVAERLNRTIFTMVRAMLFEAGLPDKFWGVAAGTVAYIKNRVAQGDSRKTPEELWTGKVPDISHLRVFGCLAYRLNNTPNKSKLESRSARSIFVGYTETSRQYRVYDPTRNQVIRTSTLKFVESRKGWATITGNSKEDETTDEENKEDEDVVELSQHNANPAKRHWQVVIRTMRYLAATAKLGITYRGCTLQDSKRNDKEKDQDQDLNSLLVGYSDSDYAGDLDNRKSTSGSTFFLASGAISWSSKRQGCVATSTTEAECIALCSAGKQAVWLRGLLLDLGYAAQGPTALYGDNNGAIELTKDSKNHARTKHIDVQYHYIREIVETSAVKIQYCPTTDMLADGLTKPLPSVRFQALFEAIGLRHID